MGALQIPLRAWLQLQVARAVVTDPRHVAGESGNEVNRLRVGLERASSPFLIAASGLGEESRQALLALAHLRCGDTYAQLAAGFEIGIATFTATYAKPSKCWPPTPRPWPRQ
jgi:hypothetical protein